MRDKTIIRLSRNFPRFNAADTPSTIPIMEDTTAATTAILKVLGYLVPISLETGRFLK